MIVTINDIEKALRASGFKFYHASIREMACGTVCFVAGFNGNKLVGFVGPYTPTSDPASCQIHTQSGEMIRLYPLTWENYEHIRDSLHLKPSICSATASFGTGDRLGLVSAAHLASLQRYPVFPIIAQQSPRELQRTGRNFRDVLLDAVMGVLESGYTSQFGADADHIKDEQYLMMGAQAGYTMYTLDISDWLHEPNIERELSDTSLAILRQYAGKTFGSHVVSEVELRKSASVYEMAIEKVKQFDNMLRGMLSSYDIEISIDESPRETTPEDHIYVAECLHRNGIEFKSLAPRFPGEFQKGIEYKGNIETLERSLRIHVGICEAIGGYRLSLHSGSDKFSIYPLFADATGGKFHIKTSGTSWLQAIKVIALTNPYLFRELYQLCIKFLEESKKAYHVSINAGDFPHDPPADLIGFSHRRDVNQLFHISYGTLLQHKRAEIFQTLVEHEPEHYSLVTAHITHHLELLFGGNSGSSG